MITVGDFRGPKRQEVGRRGQRETDEKGSSDEEQEGYEQGGRCTAGMPNVM